MRPLRGMFVDNILISLYLAYLGPVRQLGGLLLWPAVALHAGVDVNRGPLAGHVSGSYADSWFQFLAFNFVWKS